MGYLERRLGERLEPARVLRGARSVVCVALNYYQGEPARATAMLEESLAIKRRIGDRR